MQVCKKYKLDGWGTKLFFIWISIVKGFKFYALWLSEFKQENWEAELISQKKMKPLLNGENSDG